MLRPRLLSLEALICLLCGGSSWLLRAFGPIRDWFLKCPLCKEGVNAMLVLKYVGGGWYAGPLDPEKSDGVTRLIVHGDHVFQVMMAALVFGEA